MKKIGFIVEGECEELLVCSDNFRAYAIGHNLQICYPVVNARGGSNLCPKKN